MTPNIGPMLDPLIPSGNMARQYGTPEDWR